MTNFWWGLILGICLGVWPGFIIAGLCVTARKNDR